MKFHYPAGLLPRSGVLISGGILLWPVAPKEPPSVTDFQQKYLHFIKKNNIMNHTLSNLWQHIINSFLYSIFLVIIFQSYFLSFPDLKENLLLQYTIVYLLDGEFNYPTKSLLNSNQLVGAGKQPEISHITIVVLQDSSIACMTPIIRYSSSNHTQYTLYSKKPQKFSSV